MFVFYLQGELRTATALDREVASAYKLIAQATDAGGLFCRSDISLRVLDVNDNAPSFSAPYYLTSVYENAAPKALLTRLQASDPDEGELLQCYISTKNAIFPTSRHVIGRMPLLPMTTAHCLRLPAQQPLAGTVLAVDVSKQIVS